MPTMRRIAAIGRSATLLFVLSAACQRPVLTTQPTEMVVDEQELSALWDASLNVLRKFDFQPDRQDKAMGIIVTLPTTTMQWGEFWRQDVADGYSYAEASMHTIQRQVTVRFPKNGERKIDVQVDVYRLSMPESQITSASSVIQSFSGVLPDTQGNFAGLGRRQRSWVLL